MGDYIGKKIPSLLEFLENKINLNELTLKSKIKSSGKGPKPIPHKLPKNLIQEELMHVIMEQKD